MEVKIRMDGDEADFVGKRGVKTETQVTSSNLIDSYSLKVDHNFVLGAWLLLPVPSCHGHLPGDGEGPAQEEVEGQEEAMARDWCQVPAGCQGNNTPSHRVSSVPTPVTSLRTDPAPSPLTTFMFPWITAFLPTPVSTWSLPLIPATVPPTPSVRIRLMAMGSCSCSTAPM